MRLFDWFRRKPKDIPLRNWDPEAVYPRADGCYMVSPLASEFGDPKDPETRRKMDEWSEMARKKMAESLRSGNG